jgi:hypothetical protein
VLPLDNELCRICLNGDDEVRNNKGLNIFISFGDDIAVDTSFITSLVATFSWIMVGTGGVSVSSLLAPVHVEQYH